MPMLGQRFLAQFAIVNKCVAPYMLENKQRDLKLSCDIVIVYFQTDISHIQRGKLTESLGIQMVS